MSKMSHCPPDAALRGVEGRLVLRSKHKALKNANGIFSLGAGWGRLGAAGGAARVSGQSTGPQLHCLAHSLTHPMAALY